MSDKRISELTAASGLSGTELVPVVQSGVTVRATPQQFADYAGTAAPFIPSGTGATTRTVQSALRALVRSGDYSSLTNYDTASSSLTENIGVYALDIGKRDSTGARLSIVNDGSLYPIAIVDSSGNELLTVSTVGSRIDMHRFSTDGAIITLGITEAVGVAGRRMGHYAWTSRDSNSTQQTFAYVAAIADSVTAASLDSTIQLYYMDHVDGSGGGGQQPNKAVTIGRTALNLPDIPITSTSGSLTLGDATLVLSATAMTLSNNYTATRAKGVAAAGAQTLGTWNTTFSGDSGGTSDVRCMAFNATNSGSNAVANMVLHRNILTVSNSSLTGTVRAAQQTVTISGSGGATTVAINSNDVQLTSSGNIATASLFNAATPTLSSTGAITTHIGFASQDLGHATLVSTAIGHNAADITASATAAIGFRSQVTSGTGKWGFQASGSANNGFVGKTIFGTIGTTPVSAVHIQDASTGWIVQDELDANPTTSELDSLDSCAIYNKANKFVIAYNNGGTITYISIPFDGSTTTWTHSTSAP